MIKKLQDGRYQLWHKDGSAPMGPPTSKNAAYAQERAILLDELRAQGRVTSPPPKDEAAPGPRAEDVTPDTLDNRTPIWRGGDVDLYQMGETPIDESGDVDEESKAKRKAKR